MRLSIHNPITLEKVRDWYPKEIGKVNIFIARLICQRTNCWWDAKLRERYGSFLKVTSILLPIALMIIGVARHLEFGRLVLIASALIPFFQFCSKEHNDNEDACARLDLVHAYISVLWDDILKKKVTSEELTMKSRGIQDEIFEHRSKSPLILDFVYNRFRSRDEGLMDKTAEILVNEIITTNADL